MTPDQERWAEALAVARQHGSDALGFAARRIEELTHRGEVAGVERWRQIARRLEALEAKEQLQN